MPPSIPRRHWLQQAGGLLLLPAPAQAVPRPARPLRLLAGDLPPLSSPRGGLVCSRVGTLARAVGYSGRPEWLPWARALMEARTRGMALVFPLARLPEREADWHWLTVLAHEESVLWVRRDALHNLGDWDRMRNLRIGALRDSAPAMQLLRDGFRNVDYGPNEKSNARKLGMGRIQAWASVRSTADFLFDTEGVDRALLHPPLRRGLLPLYLAATPDVSDDQLTLWRQHAA